MCLLQQYTPPHYRPGSLDLLVRLDRRSGLVSAPRRGLSGRQMTEMFHFEDFVDEMEPVEHCSREKDKTLDRARFKRRSLRDATKSSV